MNEFLAFTIEPGWAVALGTALSGGVIAIARVWFKFYGDNRWQKRDDAKQDLEREVKTLQAVDAEVKKAISDLTETVKTLDTTARADMTALRGEVNRGFGEIKDALSIGILALTKEVGIMQGRLAGAGGVAKAE